MADKERISRPSSGSNELGSETRESRITGGLPGGTDTQLKLTALGGKKHKDHKKESDKIPHKAEADKKRL